MNDSLEVVLKTDARGRLRMPRERREQLLDEFERSGLSGPKFAALAGLKYQTFALWGAAATTPTSLGRARGQNDSVGALAGGGRG